MRRRGSRPIKVFVTTRTGFETFLVENNDIFDAAQPYIRRLHGSGYYKTITSANRNTAAFLLIHKKTDEPAMVTSCRLHRKAIK